MLMPRTEAQRREYSKRYHFRLPNEKAYKLDKKLQDKKITLTEFVLTAMGERRDEQCQTQKN